MSADDRYREAGVDIEKGNEFVRRISEMVKSTHTAAVMTGIGGFSGLYSLNTDKYPDPVLVSSTDGVGTKLKIAFMMNKHDTIGIDMVGMVLNDIVVTGAKPLFLLDYLATGRLELGVAEQVVAGVVEGCKQAGCALIGGETAEMPGFYPDGEYDLAGFGVGVTDRSAIIDGSSINKNSALIGLCSSGLHSNGYSLARRIVFEELGLGVDSVVDDLPAPLGEALLTPTKIYVEPVLNIIRHFDLQGVANITGGGLLENLPRVLPDSVGAVVRLGSWEAPPVFEFLRRAGKLDEREMLRTFNSGLGMVLVVPGDQAEEVVSRLVAMGQPASIIGETKPRSKGQAPVEIVD